MASAKKNGETEQLPDFATWEKEQVGFAPYWNPEEGKWIYARLVSKDDRDPEFVRYLLQAGMDTPCKRGPVGADQEDVLIKKGELFSISVYHSLQELFDLYLECGIRDYIRIDTKNKTKTSTAGRTVWNWEVLVSPETKQLANKKREEIRLLSDAGEFPPKQMST